jgi:LPXTG-motif cell wall-anchored protein
MNPDASMEMIGGADGPTAIWVAGPADGWMYLLSAALLAAAAIVLLIARRRKKK